MLQAIVVISAVAFVTINLIVDLLYPVLDPRLGRKVEPRHEQRKTASDTGAGAGPAALDRHA